MEFPLCIGVPLVIDGIRLRKRSTLPDTGFVEDVMHVFKIPPTDRSRQMVAECFSYRFGFSDDQLAVEAEQFIHRQRSSGFSIRDPYPAEAVDDSEPDRVPEAAGSEPRLSLRALVAPPQVRAGAAFAINVAIANEGPRTIGPNAAPELCLSYLWDS